MASTMLSAATKKHRSSVLPFLSLFASFGQNVCNNNGFCIFIVLVKPIKIANTPIDSSAALPYFYLTERTTAAMASAKPG